MKETLISGNASFKIDVPYKLIETGKKGEKPLIIYLHGYNQNIEYFEKKVESMFNLKAYHLFIQGPYPVYDTTRQLPVSKWGRAWYLYDGDQEQFIKSMEIASVFIQDIIESLQEKVNWNRLSICGYSMGGYLGGYFALSRWKYVNDLIVMGARIKTETFNDTLDQARHINVLALHGEKDTSVYPGPQKKCIDQLKEIGFNACFELIDTGHKLDKEYIRTAQKWLSKSGFVEC